ncbi:MAG: hypothetical protein DYG92_05975 [Leptolyngbya sp. PLA1]|nr:hypothetical protein [Leptolyngbya sp. PLA1]
MLLLLSPTRVRFGGQEWTHVRTLTISREASRRVVDFADAGPHAVFADAPEVLTRLEVRQELTSTSLEAPAPGQRAVLTAQASAGPGNGRAVTLSADAVVLSVRVEAGGERRIELVALSATGAADPITIEAV